MFRGETDGAGLLAGANPDSTGATDEREGGVADETCGPFEREGNGVIGVGADGTELVGDTKNDAGGIGTVGN